MASRWWKVRVYFWKQNIYL